MTIFSIGITKQHAARGTLLFLRLGLGIPVVFFATTIVSGFMLGNYDHMSRLVSELGALGTSSQYVFSAGLLLCSALSVLFVIGLSIVCKASGMSTLPAIIILSFSISIAGAAVFPLPLRLHLILGMPSVLLVLSPLLSFFLWTKAPRLSHIRPMSLMGLSVMSLGFLAFAPNVLIGYAGLKQRLFHVGWSIWFIYLSYSFSKMWARYALSENRR